MEGGIENNFVSRAPAIDVASKTPAHTHDSAEFTEEAAWMDVGWKGSGEDKSETMNTKRADPSNPPHRRAREGPTVFVLRLISAVLIAADCVSLGTRAVEGYRNGPDVHLSRKQAEDWIEDGHMIWDAVATIMLTAEIRIRSNYERRRREMGQMSSDVEVVLDRLDWYIAASSWVGIVVSFNGMHFTLRSLRLFRLVHLGLQLLGRKALLNGMVTMVMASHDCGAGICLLISFSLASGAIALAVLLSSVDGKCGLSSGLHMNPITFCSVSAAPSTCPEPFQCFESSDSAVHYRNILGLGLTLLQGVAVDGMDQQLLGTEQAVPELLPFIVPFFVCFFLIINYVFVTFVRSSVIHAYWRATTVSEEQHQMPSCFLVPFEKRHPDAAEPEKVANHGGDTGLENVQINMQHFAFRAIHSVGFQWFADCAVVVYVCLRLARHEGMRRSRVAAYDWAEGALVVWFFVENLVVGFAYGFAERWMHNAWRVVDFGISFTSFASLCAISSGSSSRAFRAMNTLVALRLYRILVRHPLLNAVAGRVVEALEGVAGALAVAVTALVAFALMGRILLGDALEQFGSMDEGGPRFGFRSVFWAGVTLLRLLAPDQAAELLVDTSEAAQVQKSVGCWVSASAPALMQCSQGAVLNEPCVFQSIGGLPCSIAAVVLLVVWFVLSYLLLSSLIVAPIVHAFRRPLPLQGAALQMKALVGGCRRPDLEQRCGSARTDERWCMTANRLKAIQEVILLFKTRVLPLFVAPSAQSAAQIHPQEDEEVDETQHSAHSQGACESGRPSPKQAWSEGNEGGPRRLSRESTAARSTAGGSAGGWTRAGGVTNASSRTIIPWQSAAMINRGSLRDGSQVLKLTPRGQHGVTLFPQGRSEARWGRQDSLGDRILPHPKDQDKDKVEEFGDAERRGSASSISTVNTGKGWGTRAFMMDGLELDQQWIEEISRPTTAAGEPESTEGDGFEDVEEQEAAEVTKSRASNRGCSSTSNDVRPRQSSAQDGGGRRKSVGSQSSARTSPARASPTKATPGPSARIEVQDREVQPLDRQESEIKERGKCSYCHQPVLNSQPRYKGPDGSYCHAACHDRPVRPPSAVAEDRVEERTVQFDEDVSEPAPPQKVMRKPDYRHDAPNLHMCVRRKELAFLQHLIDKGAALDIPNPKTGQTALHVACELNRLEALAALVEGGADVEAADHMGRTPVMAAARAGRLEPIRWLVARTRVNLYHKDADRKLALQMVPFHSPFTRQALENMCGWGLLAAARKGKVEKVTWLLQRGASTWLSDDNDRTALHLAAQNGRLKVVQTLIDHRANLDAEDALQKTALELAAKRNHSEVVALLTAAGARVDEEIPDREASAPVAAAKKSIWSRLQSFRKNPRKELKRLCESGPWKAFVMANATVGFLPAALYLLPHDSPYSITNAIPPAAEALAHTSTALLLVEMACKVGAYGAITSSDSLFRRWLNCIDLVILLGSICHPSFAVVCSFKAVRLIRVIPLFGRREDSERMLFGTSNSLSWLMGAAALLAVLCGAFAIAGMGLLGGLLASCSDRRVEYPRGRFDCVGYSYAGPNVLAPRVWATAPSSLDDFPSAFEAVFEAATMEWSGILADSMDATQRHLQPTAHLRSEGAVFLSVLVFVLGMAGGGTCTAIAANSVRGHRSGRADPTGAYILMVKRIQEYACRLTRGGRGSVSSQSVLEPRSVRFLFEFVSALNLIFIASLHQHTSATYDVFFQVQNHFCSVLLICELLLYVTAYGVMNTFRFSKHWCSVLALVGAGVDFVGIRETIVIRVFARTARLLLWSSELGRDGVRPFSIAATATRLSLRRVVPPLGALAVVTAIYAALGHQAFGATQNGEMLTDRLNFATFPRSTWVMFHIIGGSQWHVVMADAAVGPASCTADGAFGERGDCGSAGFATVFFVSFKMVIAVLSGLLLGSVLDCVDKARQVEDDTIDMQHLIRARQEWLFIEGSNRQGLDLDQVRTIILHLPPPLGLGDPDAKGPGARPGSPQKEKTAARSRSKLNLNGGADLETLRLQEMLTAICIAAALRNKGRVSAALDGLEQTFPDGRRTPITQLRVAPTVEYDDFILTLIHLAAPSLIPQALTSLHEAVMEHTAKVEASREIVSFIRRRWEWRRNWADLLHHVHEQAQQKRLRDKRRREEEEEQRRREMEQKEEEERLKRRREVEEIYDLRGWVARSCNLNPHKTLSQVESQDARRQSYFARCVFYELHIPFGCQQGSPLTPSVNEPIPGYPFHERSPSTFRTVALPTVPPYPSVPPRANYTATELCEVLNALIAHDLQCYIAANDRRHTHGLQEAWADMSRTLITFEVDGAETNGFRVAMTWPGAALGAEGLAAVNTDLDEVRRANVRVYAAQHSFYAMALKNEDQLFPPVGNLVMYLGFFNGNKKHWSPVLGNQNSMVLGGSNHLLDHEIPGGPMCSMTMEHQEDVLSSRDYDAEPHKLRRRAELIWRVGSKAVQVETASEAQRLFLMNYSGGYGKQRAEVLALQILQAIMRAKLARLSWTTQKLMSKKIGEKGGTRVLASKFLAKRERREASIALMLKMDQLGTPIQTQRVSFSSPDLHGFAQ